MWHRITLPYDNPWGIVGPPSQAHYHPANNIVRFLVLILLPALALTGTYRLGGARVRRLLGEGTQEGPGAEPKSPFSAVLLVAFAVLAALNIPTFHASGPLHRFHEGESLGTAVSHARGQIPYEDYLFVHGVYQDPLRAAIAFRLFGRSIGSARVLEAVAKIVAFAFLALFLREWLGAGTAAFGALLAVVALHGLVALEAMWLPLAPLRIMQRDATALAFLFALALLWRGARRGAAISAPAFLTAFIAIASFGYSIDRGFYLSATAVIAWMLLYAVFLHRGVPAGRFWLWIAAGAAAGTVLVCFLLQWRFRAFFTFTFLVMPRYKEWMDGLIYPIEKAPMWGIAALVAANLYRLSLGWLGEHQAAGRWGIATLNFFRKFFLEVCLLLLSLFFFRSALGRADLFHVTLNSWPTYLLAFSLFVNPWLSRHLLTRRVVAVAALALAAACTFRVFASNVLSENFPLRKADADYVEPGYLEAARFLRENLAPEESFFTLTSEAIWYYLVDKPCPARFPVVWFAAPHFYQQEIVEALRAKAVKFVLYRNAAPSNTVDGISNEQRLPILVNYIRENYRPFRNVAGHEIWIRK